MGDGYGLLGFGVVGKVASATVIAVGFENVVAADAAVAAATTATTDPISVMAASRATLR
jgi:hypothetical protein